MTAQNSKWELYDRLIDGVPGDLRAEEILVCRGRTLVTAECGCGIAMTVENQVYPSQIKKPLNGKPLKE